MPTWRKQRPPRAAQASSAARCADITPTEPLGRPRFFCVRRPKAFLTTDWTMADYRGRWWKEKSETTRLRLSCHTFLNCGSGVRVTPGTPLCAGHDAAA
jgi:hypothetical protein